MQYPEEMVRPKIEEGMRDTIGGATRRGVSRAIGPHISATIDRYSGASPSLRKSKENAIQNLASLLEQTVKNLEGNGFKVYRAKTSLDAVNYAASVIKPDSLVVKSKSNAAKETGVEQVLAKRGVSIVETDMGDRICQLGKIRPSHPLGPALHVPVAKVAELFSHETGRVINPDPSEIVSVARELLRQDFLRADYGMSGANAIAADTGSIVLTENEGNIRTVTNLPRVHLVFAGIEKIVATLEEAVNVCHTAAVYGTGASVGQYINIISGPACTTAVDNETRPGGQGPREVHVILLEEGRWDAINGGFEQSLYCINCGHCLGVCPIYGEVGEQYGYKYFGGIGIVHTALRNGLDKAAENGLSLCVGCRQCVTACPARISTPDMIQRLRRQGIKKYGLKFSKRVLLKQYLGKNSAMVQKLGRSLQPVLLQKNSRGYTAPFAVGDLSKERLIPALAKETALEALPEENFAPNPDGPWVAYFAGCLHNRFFPEISRATVEVLNKQGINVYLPHKQECCGYPMLAAGQGEGAKQLAKTNLAALLNRPLEAVVVDCPTCGSALRGYGELLSDEPEWSEKAKGLSTKVRDVFELIYAKPEFVSPKGVIDSKVTYHNPCHLEALELRQAAQVLERIPGLNIGSLEAQHTCCGFGGTFSLDHYDLAAVIAGRKVEAALNTGSDILATACPGCMLHLADGLLQKGSDIQVKHVVELLAESYRQEGSEVNEQSGGKV